MSTFKMLKTLWKLSLSSFLFIFSLQPVYAMEKGFYLGSHLDYSEFAITNDNTIDFTSAEAAKIYLGYNFLPHLGLEIGYMAFSDFSSQKTDVEISLIQTTIGISLAGELSDKVDLLLKAHASYNELEVNNAGTAIDDSKDVGWIYELGLRYYVLESLALTGSIAYGLTSYENNDFDYTTSTAGLGLQFNF